LRLLESVQACAQQAFFHVLRGAAKGLRRSGASQEFIS